MPLLGVSEKLAVVAVKGGKHETLSSLPRIRTAAKGLVTAFNPETTETARMSTSRPGRDSRTAQIPLEDDVPETDVLPELARTAQIPLEGEDEIGNTETLGVDELIAEGYALADITRVD